MKAKAALILRPFAIGIMAFLLTFMIMTATTPIITTVFAGLLYFLFGIWLRKMQPQTLWYAPLLVSLPICVIFMSMGVEFWPPVIRIWYFLIPPLTALPAAYLGMCIQSNRLFYNSVSPYVTKSSAAGAKPTSITWRTIRNCVLLFVTGFGCMFICLLLLFLFNFYLGLSFGLGYALSYLFVYPPVAVILVWKYSDEWMMVAVLLCLSPILYWFFLLCSDGKLGLSKISFSDSTIMVLIMPLTLALSCLAAFATYRLKHPNRITSN